MSDLTCNRADLAWALKAVLPHASRDKKIEILCGIRLEVVPAEHTLYCVATDRYTLGAATVEFTGDHDAAEVTLPSAEVRDLLRKLTAGNGGKEARVSVTDRFVLLDDFYRFKVMPVIIRPGYPAKWIQWRDLLGKMLRYPPGVPGPDTGYNSAYLARFGQAATPEHGVTVMPVRSTGAQRSSLTVVLAENFAGAVMGRRQPETIGPAHLRRWRELIPASQRAADRKAAKETGNG